MSLKKRKFNGSEQHYMAILHLIGESVEVFHERPVIADVAEWMNVSKTTARKYLRIMNKIGDISMVIKPYKTFGVTEIDLSYYAMMQYRNGEFRRAYELYAQKVMGIILQHA